MTMRRKTIEAAVMVMLLVTLLIPLARTLSAGQRSPDNDADRMILPILEMLDQSPQVNAQTEVEPILEIEEVWAIEDTREEIGGVIDSWRAQRRG